MWNENRLLLGDFWIKCLLTHVWLFNLERSGMVVRKIIVILYF